MYSFIGGQGYDAIKTDNTDNTAKAILSVTDRIRPLTVMPVFSKDILKGERSSQSASGEAGKHIGKAFRFRTERAQRHYP